MKTLISQVIVKCKFQFLYIGNINLAVTINSLLFKLMEDLSGTTTKRTIFVKFK